MKIRHLIALAALGSGAFADGLSSGKRARIAACMGQSDYAAIGFSRVLASRIFAAIDVTIDWKDLRHCPTDAIRIRLSAPTPAALLPGALGYTFPYEGVHIVIFYDRIQRAVSQGRIPALTAHVIAHEMAHLLEGVSQHSRSGIMKASWNSKDYMEMSSRALLFAPEDIALIHAGLERRSTDGEERR